MGDAGCSGTPLPRKLGLTDGQTPAFFAAPPEVKPLKTAADFAQLKLCAVDAVWSGLKLVIPVAQRGR